MKNRRSFTVLFVLLSACAGASLATAQAPASAPASAPPPPSPPPPDPAIAEPPGPTPTLPAPVLIAVPREPRRLDRANAGGLGIVVGNTISGITGKVWFSSGTALAAAVGSGSIGNNLRLQIDVTQRVYRWEGKDAQYAFVFYGGLGGQLGIFLRDPSPARRTEAGLRVPVGMSVIVPDNPVELFLEVAPAIGSYSITVTDPMTGASVDDSHVVLNVDGAVGARFYF